MEAGAGPLVGGHDLTVEALAELVPGLSRAAILDVVEQCGNNVELALDGLLAMAEAQSPRGPLAPPPLVPQTRQDQYAVLFPAEKKRPTQTPSTSQNPSSVDNHPTGDSLPAQTTAATAASLPPMSSTLQNEQEGSMALEEICPWLVSLDGGHQHPSPVLKAGLGAPLSRPSRKAASRSSRGWWPCWSPASDGFRSHRQGGACTSTGSFRPPVSSAGLPPPTAGATQMHYCEHRLELAWSDVVEPPGASQQSCFLLPATPGAEQGMAPSNTSIAAADSHRASGEPAPATALPPASLAVCTAPTECGGTIGTSSLCAAATSEPTADSRATPEAGRDPLLVLAADPLPPALQLLAEAQHEEVWANQQVQQHSHSDQQQQQHGGYGPTDLLRAVEFHSSMFPNLKPDVVGDVLQRYSDTPQTALDQLIMLSSCVNDAATHTCAATTATSAVGSLPDQQAWEADSGDGFCGGSDDEFAAGSSWEQELTPAELEAIEAGVPLELLLAAPRQRDPPQRQQQQVPHQQQHRPLSPEGEDAMPAEEKLELLQLEFASISVDEVSASLAACDGSLFAAAKLLRAFLAEDDAAKSSDSDGRGNMIGDAPRSAAAAASVPAAASASAALPHHAWPKVQHLSQRFPEVPIEALEVALVSSSYSLANARRTLREAGYTEVDLEPTPRLQPQLYAAFSTAASTAVPPAPPPPSPQPHPQELLQPLPPAPGTVAGPSMPSVHGAPASLSLSEATYQRNQAIFEQERAQAQRLQMCYRRCFELAAAAYTRGDHDTANELRLRGHQYREQYDQEKRRASRRISKRVNAGTLPIITVDLHGLHVDEALRLVESGLRSLPESIPGGVTVRYITGKGLHSAGGAPRIKPEVLRLLAERGVPHEQQGGIVEVTLRQAVT